MNTFLVYHFEGEKVDERIFEQNVSDQHPECRVEAHDLST